MSHRAVMMGAIANGQTTVSGILRAEDVERTVDAFRALGVSIEDSPSDVVIEGVGLDGLQEPNSAIYCGNSGTAMRLLTGLLAGQPFATVLTGDESLSTRPMERVVTPLKKMGADITLTEHGTAPIEINPVRALEPINWELPVASAQLMSAVLFAGLYCSSWTKVSQSIVSRDHTITMLEMFGADVQRSGIDAAVRAGRSLTGQNVAIPADFSSAAFFIVAALLVPDSNLVLRNVGVNKTRTGLLQVLRAMGASIETVNERMVGNEAVADVVVSSAKDLRGVNVDADLVPLMVDEIPILAIAAATARGRSELSGCRELRFKESDRIGSTVTGLKALGIKVEEREDGMVIEGGSFSGGEVDSFGDHRIAMSFAIAGAVANSQVVVKNCNCVDTSFPEFAEIAKNCGIKVSEDVDEHHHD